MGASPSTPKKSLHEFIVKDEKGKDVDLSIYKGKVLIVVNVASKCGFANFNYSQLTELHNRFKGQAFEILAFPCNQFMNQEPGTGKESHEFACMRYQAEFPIFEKVRCNGPEASPVYKFLRSSKSSLFGSRIKWNFTKFLVDQNGHVLKRYGTTASALTIEFDIKKVLGEP